MDLNFHRLKLDHLHWNAYAPAVPCALKSSLSATEYNLLCLQDLTEPSKHSLTLFFGSTVIMTHKKNFATLKFCMMGLNKNAKLSFL